MSSRYGELLGPALVIVFFVAILCPPTIYSVEIPPPLNIGEEWLYNMTIYNKTTGETISIYSDVSVEDSSDQYYVLHDRVYSPYTEETFYERDIVIDQEWRIHNITIHYQDGYSIEYVYQGDELPYFIVFPSSTDESLSLTTYADVYINGEYYFTDKDVYDITVLRQDNIIYNNHVIPSYVVSTYCEIRDPDTDYLYGWYNETIWVNIDFKLPFTIIYEDDSVIIVSMLISYTLTPDPIDNYPSIGEQKVFLAISLDRTGNYTSGVPDTNLIVENEDSAIVATYSISQLPVSIELDPGTYTLAIEEPYGETTDKEGYYTFLYWSVNGINYADSTVTVDLQENTSVVTVFEVNSYPEIPPTEYVRLSISYNIMGDYTTGIPDTTLTISNSSGIIGTYHIDELPVQLDIVPGRYSLSIASTTGNTTDDLGYYEFRKWIAMGNEYATQTITINIQDDASVVIEFIVNKYMAETPTTTTTTPITTTTESTAPPETTTSADHTTTSNTGTTQLPASSSTTPIGIAPGSGSGGTGGSGGDSQYIPGAPVTGRTTGPGEWYMPTLALVAIGGAVTGIVAFIALKFLRKPKALSKPVYPVMRTPPRDAMARPVATTMPTTATTSPAKPPMRTYKVCPYCGASIPAKARFCPKCGKPQPIETGKESETSVSGGSLPKYKVCPYCGSRIPIKAKYCPKCGAKLE